MKTNVYSRHGKTGISKKNKELELSLKREAENAIEELKSLWCPHGDANGNALKCNRRSPALRCSDCLLK